MVGLEGINVLIRIKI